MIIDTHAHLFDEAFDPDRSEVLERARKSGVSGIILPGIDSESHERLIQCYRDYPQIMYPSMGLHPTSVNSSYLNELSMVRHYLDDPAIPWVAVGEIGLDYYWSTAYKKEQQEAFSIQLHWASERQLPVIIHCREAMGDVLQVMASESLPLKGVFHAYSGSFESYQQILKLGDFKLGIGGVLTYKNAHLPELLQKVPIQDIVLETDAPYLSPVPFRGKRNESAYLVHIVQQLSEIYTLTIDQIQRITTQNACKIFGISRING